MTEATAGISSAMADMLSNVMVLSIVSIGLNIFMICLVIAALIMAIIYLARKNRHVDD